MESNEVPFFIGKCQFYIRNKDDVWGRRSANERWLRNTCLFFKSKYGKISFLFIRWRFFDCASAWWSLYHNWVWKDDCQTSRNMRNSKGYQIQNRFRSKSWINIRLEWKRKIKSSRLFLWNIQISFPTTWSRTYRFKLSCKPSSFLDTCQLVWRQWLRMDNNKQIFWRVFHLQSESLSIRCSSLARKLCPI